MYYNCISITACSVEMDIIPSSSVDKINWSVGSEVDQHKVMHIYLKCLLHAPNSVKWFRSNDMLCLLWLINVSH